VNFFFVSQSAALAGLALMFPPNRVLEGGCQAAQIPPKDPELH